MEDKTIQQKKRDRWEKFQILAQVLIGVAAAVFAGFFGWHQHQNAKAALELSRSNYEIARSQAQVALLPALTSEDPRQRAMALHMASALDEKFASVVAGIAAVRDSSKIVQRSAKITLENLSKSEQFGVKLSAEGGLNQYDLMTEIRALGLQKDLDSARNFIEGGSADGTEKAVSIYHRILTQLPYSVLRRIDHNLLRSAQEDERYGYVDSAARKYRALFPEITY